MQEDEHPFAGLKRIIHEDPEYAWAMHCNIAVPIMDAIGVEHGASNTAAAHVMRTLFDYDITTHPHYLGEKSAAQSYFEARVAAEREEDTAISRASSQKEG